MQTVLVSKTLKAKKYYQGSNKNFRDAGFLGTDSKWKHRNVLKAKSRFGMINIVRVTIL